MVIGVDVLFFFIIFILSIDVEQPYCILELSHPKQIYQTSLAKNGVNPYAKFFVVIFFF